MKNLKNIFAVLTLCTAMICGTAIYGISTASNALENSVEISENFAEAAKDLSNATIHASTEFGDGVDQVTSLRPAPELLALMDTRPGPELRNLVDRLQIVLPPEVLGFIESAGNVLEGPEETIPAEAEVKSQATAPATPSL